TTTPQGALPVKLIEPPCTERYARWCERSVGEIIAYLLLDLMGKSAGEADRDLYWAFCESTDGEFLSR
ncbi:hypothetical protein, partial [Bianquea renquensis]|uniref:hypothetical protein n=1 Tax=Bianquea renquensis TaxID=2763661 RepID=UPI002016764F